MKNLNVRIDERLIHGQVATMWTNILGVNRIIVVDDNVINNETEKEVLKMAKPGNLKLSILSIKGASERIRNGQYNEETILVLVKSPKTINEMVNLGVEIDEVTVGNISKKSDSKEITKSVSINKEEEKCFLDLYDKGIKIYSQMVPNDNRKDFTKLIKGGR
ncbi:PTS system mannose/fructose/N-acetylgalactosamine-transporter subunit IIB [Helcococcus kunzii]|uniref:PTS system mannose/fructose/N-acetylgalactosamine-transporter subunit IIB n=1 Tax=Helcococcus kunzii TaxID=40091 RepID=UPI0038A2292F